MNLPRTQDDLDGLITNEVQESLHIEYKDSRELETGGKDVPKEISAFANSDGGILIFGIREEGHKPISIDTGVDHSRHTREWLEDIITGNVAPYIENLEIVQIPLTNERSVYAVNIPKSYRGPHQDRKNKRYYKRFNFKAQPMEDYEIADIRSRTLTLPPLVSFDIEIKHKSLVYFSIRNIGNAVARNVSFTFSPTPTWRRSNNIPPILTQGIEFFPPNREFQIFYQSFIGMFEENNNVVTVFDIQAKYTHSASGVEVCEDFHIDLGDYLYTSETESDLEIFGKKLCESIDKLTSELKQVKNQLSPLATIAGPTGLDLSVTSMRELSAIIGKQAPQRKIDPTDCRPEVFQEILEIDVDLAQRLSSHFWNSNRIEGLLEMEQIDEELIEQIKLYFIVS